MCIMFTASDILCGISLAINVYSFYEGTVRASKSLSDGSGDLSQKVERFRWLCEELDAKVRRKILMVPHDSRSRALSSFSRASNRPKDILRRSMLGAEGQSRGILASWDEPDSGGLDPCARMREVMAKMSTISNDIELRSQVDSYWYSLRTHIHDFLFNPSPTQFIIAFTLLCVCLALLYRRRRQDRYQNIILGISVSMAGVGGFLAGDDATGVLLKYIPTIVLGALLVSEVLHRTILQEKRGGCGGEEEMTVESKGTSDDPEKARAVEQPHLIEL